MSTSPYESTGDTGGSVQPVQKRLKPRRDLSHLHPDANITEPELCEFLQMSRSTERNKRQKNGPYYDESFPAPADMKNGSAVRFRWGDIVDWNRAQHGLPPLYAAVSRRGGE